MSLFLLDTDTLSLVEQRHTTVLQRLNSHPRPDARARGGSRWKRPYLVALDGSSLVIAGWPPRKSA
jgi:hypothetical protein